MLEENFFFIVVFFATTIAKCFVHRCRGLYFYIKSLVLTTAVIW